MTHHEHKPATSLKQNLHTSNKSIIDIVIKIENSSSRLCIIKSKISNSLIVIFGYMIH